jgi:Carbohydrate binding module (family 6)/Bacterial Ig domain/PA14 domain
VVIQKNQWFSLTEALSSGLTLGKGTHLGGPAQVSGAGLDFDSKRMLDVGLVGDGGQVEFTQAVPNGDWDLTLWIAGPSEVQFSHLALTAGGSPVELDLAATKAERYRRIGPYRLQIRNHVMDLRLSGMGNAHVAGMKLNAAGPLDGSMPPMIMITNPSADSEISSTNLVISVRSISDGGIAKVVFYNRDTLLGEATKSPFTFNWNGAVIGPFALTAVATDTAGVSSRSPTIVGVVLDPSQARGLTREIWHNIPSRTVNELRKHLASPPSKVDVVPHTNHDLTGGNFGVRFRATLIPPITGDYILEVVSDDQSEVWLSSDEDPINRRLVCSVPDFAAVGQWTAFPSQRSQSIAFIKDQRCFVEILYKQESGAAHIILGWVRPDGVNERPIPASCFSPVPVTNALPPPRSTVPITGGAVAQTAPVDPNTPIGPPGYIWCANEGGSFKLNGINDVAYGIDGKFFFLYKQTGTILFVHETFGGDPVPGYPKAGFYKPASGNGVTAAVNGIPPIIPREIPQVPLGSFVQGTVAPAALVVNLSEQGATDWIHYGLKDATSFVRHQAGSDRISVARTVDGAPVGRFAGNQTYFSWNNGNALATGVGIKTSWTTGNRGKGFTFTAPADLGLRRLMVWVGGHETHGIFTATLSDGSAPVYRDDSINIGAGWDSHCFTVWYRAKQPGAKLTIGFGSDRATDGNIILQAAALTEYDEGKSRFIKAVNFGGKTVQVAGNQWLAQTTAESTDLVVHEGRRVSATGDPVPAVDAAMKEVLKTGVAGKATDLEINERVANGRYSVTLYVMETSVANSRLFDVTAHDASLMDIGQLPQNGWAAYGPLTTTVTNGVLSLTAKAKKGSPQIMGMSIFTMVNEPWTNAFPAGRAHVVPGTLQFADFDRGANGVAFQEQEQVQRNPIYRMEPVGIYSDQGTPVIAYVSDGEWLRFTINAKESGTYAITVKYAKASVGSSRVEFEVDGKAVANALSLEETAGWDKSKTLTTIEFPLSAGVHDLRTLFYGPPPQGVANFWSMEFVRTRP